MKLGYRFKALLAAAGLLAFSNSQSAVIFSGDFVSDAGQIQITLPINFNITSNSDAWILVFDELVPSDGTNDADMVVTGTLDVTANGSDISTGPNWVIDNAAGAAANDVTANDGYIYWNFAIPVNIGETFIVQASSLSVIGGGGFNPNLNSVGAFVGNVFLADSNGVRVSDIVSVPTSPAIALMGLGLFGMAGFRRRANR